MFGGKVGGICTVGCGIIFRLAPDGSETILHKFEYSEGAFPNAVIMDGEGDFYGTTSGGGAEGYGAVFELTR